MSRSNLIRLITGTLALAAVTGCAPPDDPMDEGVSAEAEPLIIRPLPKVYLKEITLPGSLFFDDGEIAVRPRIRFINDDWDFTDYDPDTCGFNCGDLIPHDAHVTALGTNGDNLDLAGTYRTDVHWGDAAYDSYADLGWPTTCAPFDYPFHLAFDPIGSWVVQAPSDRLFRLNTQCSPTATGWTWVDYGGGKLTMSVELAGTSCGAPPRFRVTVVNGSPIAAVLDPKLRLSERTPPGYVSVPAAVSGPSSIPAKGTAVFEIYAGTGNLGPVRPRLHVNFADVGVTEPTIGDYLDSDDGYYLTFSHMLGTGMGATAHIDYACTRSVSVTTL